MNDRMMAGWAKWRGLISEQARSGQTVVVFCRERGVRESLFYAWKRRIREAEAGQFVEVKVAAPEEARLPEQARDTTIEIRLPKGRSLIVDPGFDAHHLRAVLAVLDSVS